MGISRLTIVSRMAKLFQPIPGGSFLSGSGMFVSFVLVQLPTRSDLCETVKAIYKSSVLNTCCCLIHCKLQTVAVLSIYRSPSTCVNISLTDL